MTRVLVMIGKGREPARDEPRGSSCPAGAASSGKRSTIDDGGDTGGGRRHDWLPERGAPESSEGGGDLWRSTRSTVTGFSTVRPSSLAAAAPASGARRPASWRRWARTW